MAANSFSKQYVVGKSASKKLLSALKGPSTVTVKPGSNLVSLSDLSKRLGK